MRVLLSGGGTGGHIYPALALMKSIKEQYPESEFLYVGTERGLESRIVPENNVPFKAIAIQGFKRSLSLDNLKTIYLFLKSVQTSKKIVAEFKPDIVIGTGGYVCGPVVYAASKLGIKSIIHEQNSLAGITNKFLARYVDAIAICFEEAKEQFGKYANKVVYTGNPRAQEVANVQKSSVLKEFSLNPEEETVLIFGGSRGAQRINEAFILAFDALMQKEYQVLFVSGELHYEFVMNEIKEKLRKNSKGNIKVVPYIKNMPSVFASVSVVISRSGATSLAELTALGVPTILIPSPNVTGDHQTYNAKSLVNKGAALLLEEKDLTAEALVEEIDILLENHKLREEMALQAKKMGVPDSADRLIELILKLQKKSS
ncbi:undecaprenyldiphospho-muramoylpentapeptide beta-N-acetylglucosaminyltransferase [Lacticigenium naphthae]|uniref:undecaprenyldiphospho-muramoylpentapeptide beta-N-acetylglucosaminyltransferase n=1 Tax=Lacticigenium naphthae TaxID=515351 RepID=UPI000423927F|nr:undecaprenyldiphospho-muramoylpentapeptide beta-N-acetylglucosaminyltransferase [Lacticigenium naphthae]